MKFCSKCGEENKEKRTVCTYCGNDLESDIILKAEIANKILLSQKKGTLTILPEEDLTLDKKLTKRTKISIILVTVLITAAIVIVQVRNSFEAPMKLEARFQNDIISNNTSDLVSILYCNDARIIIDSKSIKPLIAYFKSHPSYYNQVIRNLNNDALSPKNISNLSADARNILTLTKIGNKFFIFPNYKIDVKPSFVDITTQVKGVAFSLNDTQIGKSDTDKSTKKFGPYIPGDYLILANYKGKYVTLSQSYPVDLTVTTNGITKLNVLDDLDYLNITSSYLDAKVFVNGKDVNMTIKDSKNFGPVNTATRIYATRVMDGKVIKSKGYLVTKGEKNLNISFQDEVGSLDVVSSQLRDLLGHYTSSFTQAVNTNNIALIAAYVTPGSELYKTQQSYIPTKYKAGLHENIISASITNYNISAGSKSGSITTLEVYNVVNKDGISPNTVFKYTYKFQYNDTTHSYQFTNLDLAK